MRRYRAHYDVIVMDSQVFRMYSRNFTPEVHTNDLRNLRNVYVIQVLALMQVHPKESLGRVIHDSKVVRCLKMWDTGFISTLCHRYLSMNN